MSNINDGGPAFPRAGFYHEDGKPEADCEALDGMSLRDFFAARALEGWLSTYGGSDFPTGGYASIVANNTYTMADAMIKARKATSKTTS